MDDLIKSIIAAITGGVLWEGFKFIYPELKRFLDNYYKAKKNLYDNLDPMLKASDELFGKIISLAKEDFSTFINENNSIASDVSQNRLYVCYLFSQFWAQIEYIRMSSQYYSLARIKKGKQLLRFIETYESREFRLLDRSIQRIIGETLIEDSGGTFKIMSLSTFANETQKKDSNLNKWIKLLEDKLNSSSDKVIRQRFLVFGIIVACLIEHYDPKYKIVRKREIYLNKLSEKSNTKIQKSLFTEYLNFVKNKNKYFKQ
ncbi:hypothetical protein [Labilibaculum manganireducens]|uniref:hypothetical protein n=1 Tax=Labilibaculum manganireducens TaxID=1940525 RepID=UPI0029F5A12B|nr:hypothetical protein [Labilibaculum manganireducens]